MQVQFHIKDGEVRGWDMGAPGSRPGHEPILVDLVDDKATQLRNGVLIAKLVGGKIKLVANPDKSAEKAKREAIAAARAKLDNNPSLQDVVNFIKLTN